MINVGWADGVAQVVESLPSKCEDLSSNPRTAKKKQRLMFVVPYFESNCSRNYAFQG
jgi:hypothetical protein